MASYTVDARRLLCPMPVIKTQNLAKTLEHGDQIEIFATDPGAQMDLPCWCEIHGHQLLESTLVDGEIRMLIKLVKQTT